MSEEEEWGAWPSPALDSWAEGWAPLTHDRLVPREPLPLPRVRVEALACPMEFANAYYVVDMPLSIEIGR